MLVVYTGFRGQLDYINAIVAELHGRNDGSLVYVIIGDDGAVEDFKNSDTYQIYQRYIKIIQSEKLPNPSRWVRDPITLLNGVNPKKIKIVETSSVEQRGEDSEMAEVLCKKLKANKFDVDNFPFDGGNILADKDFVFVGANQFNQWLSIINLGINSKKRYELIEKGKLEFKKVLNLSEVTKIIVIGDIEIRSSDGEKTRQYFDKKLFNNGLWFPPKLKSGSKEYQRSPPNEIEVDIPHIDLFLTLTGLIDEMGKYYLLLGKVTELEGSVLGEKAKKRMLKLNEYLEKVQESLVKENLFNVLRAPIPMIQLEEETDWCFGFYNNCIVEVSSTFEKVWLPLLSKSESLSAYREKLEKVEREWMQAWSRCGVKSEEMVWIPYSLYKEDLRKRGSLHCLTKEIR